MKDLSNDALLIGIRCCFGESGDSFGTLLRNAKKLRSLIKTSRAVSFCPKIYKTIAPFNENT